MAITTTVTTVNAISDRPKKKNIMEFQLHAKISEFSRLSSECNRFMDGYYLMEASGHVIYDAAIEWIWIVGSRKYIRWSMVEGVCVCVTVVSVMPLPLIWLLNFFGLYLILAYDRYYSISFAITSETFSNIFNETRIFKWLYAILLFVK